MRLRDYQTALILNELRTFNYQTKVDGQEVTVNVELFPASMLGIANKIFLQKQGDLRADEIMAEYLEGEVTAADIAGIIKTTHVQKWKHWLEMWKAEYDPLANVDGSEVHTIVTQYGKITTMAKNTTDTTQYGKVTTMAKNTTDTTTYNSELEMAYDSKNKTTYNSNETAEQLSDGKYNTTHGHIITKTEPQTDNAIAAFDSVTPVPHSETILTQHSDTNSGTDQIAISDGKKKTDRGGYDEQARDGKDTNSHSGTDTLARSGSDTDTLSGSDTLARTGSDTDTLSGSDTTTDTYVRSGNLLGVTTTQKLLTEEDEFWSQFSFFDMWYSDIAEELTLSIYE